MAKKSKGKSKKEAAVTLQQTGKFTVLDAPGVTQPVAETIEPEAATDAPKKSNKDGAQGRRANASSGPRMGNDSSDKSLIGEACFSKREKDPAWLKERFDLFDTIAKKRADEIATKQLVPIQVTLPDGKVLSQYKDGSSYMAWKTTPYEVAATISQGLADSVAVCRITYSDFVPDYDLYEDGMGGVDYMEEAMIDGGVEQQESTKKTYLWDLTRPIVGNVGKIELLKFGDDSDARTVFWHSSAHMLGEAMEHLWGARLCIGPPLKGGFYYDCYMGNEDVIKEEDCKFSVQIDFNKSVSTDH